MLWRSRCFRVFEGADWEQMISGFYLSPSPCRSLRQPRLERAVLQYGQAPGVREGSGPGELRYRDARRKREQPADGLASRVDAAQFRVRRGQHPIRGVPARIDRGRLQGQLGRLHISTGQQMGHRLPSEEEEESRIGWAEALRAFEVS